MKALNTLSNSITIMIGRTKTFTKQNSAELLLVGGAIGVVAGTVMACRATLKVNDILDAHKAEKEKILRVSADEYYPEYTEENAKTDLKNLTIKTAVSCIACYAPAVLLEAFSIGTIFASNRIMRQRNAALAASCATIEAAYKKYRERVVERFGKDVDEELYYGLTTEKKKVTKTDPETGEKVKEVETKTTLQQQFACSPYAQIFDERALEFYQDDGTNLFMLKQREKEATVRLRASGVLSLNEVYDMIGLPATDIGLTHGWIYERDNQDGDNEVQFDLRHVYITNEITGEEERVILIDFNCDGYIYGRINHGRKIG